MNAAFMSFQPFQPHESGIHAVWPGAGEARVTEVRFRRTPRLVARPERTKISRKYVMDGAVVAGALFRVRAARPPGDARLTGSALERPGEGIHVVFDAGPGPGTLAASLLTK